MCITLIYLYAVTFLETFGLKRALSGLQRKFGPAVAVWGCFVCYGFYTLVWLTDKVQVEARKMFSSRLELEIFMAALHVWPAIVGLLELAVVAGRTLDQGVKATFVTTLSYVLSYAIFQLYTVHYNGVYPYEAQNNMTHVQLVVFDLYMACVLFALCYMCARLNSRWARIASSVTASRPKLQ
ncbi:hypothetical protein CYMTET_33626 [Cymbomonas tetramitiformis]|uniref:Uncharacterized protein n=1 Tax=Cymbomonas tetramitiformis TaxID=36881 RepID=A0AAE0FCV8_9CHLO|nr:hypothetical protein CYMTET_33626 [Cymbomonas tetramitiformis]